MNTITIPPLVTIDTVRLRLREFTLADATAVFQIMRQTAVFRFADWEPPLSPYDTEEMLQRYLAWQFDAPRLHLVLAITLPAEQGKLIGTIGLNTTNEATAEAELGFNLDPDYWRRGLATEAAQAMIEYGLATAGWRRIFATCDVDNKASEKVLRKLGMVEEGVLTRHKLRRGVWRDSLLFAISRS